MNEYVVKALAFDTTTSAALPMHFIYVFRGLPLNEQCFGAYVP